MHDGSVDPEELESPRDPKSSLTLAAAWSRSHRTALIYLFLKRLIAITLQPASLNRSEEVHFLIGFLDFAIA
jgi:hypothetical protein